MSTRTTSINLKSLLIFVILLVSLIFTVGTIAECDGTWVESSALVCQTGKTCAEWDVGGTSLGACCISAEAIGTGHLEACEGPLIQ